MFSLAWVESTVYAIDGSGLLGPRRPTYSNWEIGSMDFTFVIFANWTTTVYDLGVVTGKWAPWTLLRPLFLTLLFACCNWERVYAKLL